MTGEKVLYIAKNKMGVIVLTGLLIAALAFLFLVVSQKNFKSSSDLLVVQSQEGFSDYYALSKSAEYMTSILTGSIYSEKFLGEVERTNLIKLDFLPRDKGQRLKVWGKIIQVQKSPNPGIIRLVIFADDQRQISQLSDAVLNVMTNKASSFLGDGKNITVQVLSGPIIEKNPTKSNIVLATVGGFLVGIILSFIWAYWQAERMAARFYQNAKNNEFPDYSESLDQIGQY